MDDATGLLFDDLEPDEVPEILKDETKQIAPGETGYWLLLDEAEVEALVAGTVPEEVGRKCHSMLEPKRRRERMAAAREAAQ